jgi:hypothetical protein
MTASVSGYASFVPESRGDPVRAYGALVIAGAPYNLWLTENVLLPILRRWSGDDASATRSGAAIAHDVEWSSGLARIAFQEIFPIASGLGDPAVLAAVSVTANLQRTVAILAEAMLQGKGSSGTTASPTFSLSRLWCGMIDYPKGSSYFPAAIRPPVHSDRLPPYRDPRHLTNVFWCGVADIERACDESIVVLREAVLREGIVSAGDLHHLDPHASLGRLQRRNRSAREKKSA